MSEDQARRHLEAFNRIAADHDFTFKNSDALRLVSALLSTHALAAQVFLFSQKAAQGTVTDEDYAAATDRVRDSSERIDVLIESLANMIVQGRPDAG